MRIALLAPGYPSTDAPRDYAFVHARGKLYAEAGQAVRAFTGNTRSVPGDDIFEGIEVERARWLELKDRIRRWSPDVVAVHAPYFRVIDVAEALATPQVVWIHGHEALWTGRSREWARGVVSRAAKAMKGPVRNAYQWWRLRSYLNHVGAVVFVSRWMQRSAESFLRRHVPKASVIPNPVDTKAFAYGYRPSQRLSGVAVRSLENSKYGIDLAIEAFRAPMTAHLTIVGSGALAGQYRALARRVDANVSFVETGVRHAEMPGLLAEHGFFLAPSRVEAQGVAMCEAMAVGLPVIATSVGGIPEFVTHGEEGLLVPPESPELLRAAVQAVTNDPAGTARMSRNARERILRDCSEERIIARELELLAAKGATIGRPGPTEGQVRASMRGDTQLGR